MQFDWKDALKKMWVGFTSQMLKINWGVMIRNGVQWFFREIKGFIVGAVKDIFGT